MLDARAGVYGRWYPDGVCNTCHNAVDRHVAAGHGERVAIIHDSPVTGTIRKLTYAELKTEVETLAAVIRDFGVEKGDRVLIYMPMIPETLIAMLACARIGAVHSVVFGGFAARELATRIDDCRPALLLAASCGIEPGRVVPYKPLVDEAMRLATVKPSSCLILQRPQCEAELDGRIAIMIGPRRIAKAKAAGNAAPCVQLLATDPLYVLYTSGTTGKPKGVVRDNGGHMVALNWSMSNLYGVEAGDTYWAASDVGWVVGHSYIVYAPLIAGCTSVVYEGKPVGTPDAGSFWRVIAEHKVRSFFTAPTAFRAIKKEDPQAKHLERYDVSCLERALPRGRARRSRYRRLGRAHPEEARHRPLVADRDGLVHRRKPARPRSLAGEARLADRRHAGLRAASGGRGRAARAAEPRWARSSSSCRCRPAPSRRSGKPMTACATATSPTSPASTRRRMPAFSTRTAMSS